MWIICCRCLYILRAYFRFELLNFARGKSRRAVSSLFIPGSPSITCLSPSRTDDFFPAIWRLCTLGPFLTNKRGGRRRQPKLAGLRRQRERTPAGAVASPVPGARRAGLAGNDKAGVTCWRQMSSGLRVKGSALLALVISCQQCRRAADIRCLPPIYHALDASEPQLALLAAGAASRITGVSTGTTARDRSKTPSSRALHSSPSVVSVRVGARVCRCCADRVRGTLKDLQEARAAN